MADELAYIGELSIGVCLPGPVLAIDAALPNLQAQIAALAGFSATVTPPSFSADLSLAAGITTNLSKATSAGITPPTISAQLSIVAALLASLQAQLDIVMSIVDLFAAGGVHAYAYSGTSAGFGSTVTTALASGFPGGSGGSQSCHALILATTIGATWGAMGTVFKVSA